jgi:acetoin utilization protein AcuB
MSKRKLSVRQYMTEAPHTVGAEQTLAAAHELMRKYQVRHLPVLHGGKLVGLLSVRDLHLVETLPDVDPNQVLVEEAMSGEPFTVRPDADLAEVAAEMAEQKLGSAVVTDGTKVIGVLTTVDALRALADALTAPK